MAENNDTTAGTAGQAGRITLEPVDAVSITTLIDNRIDVFLPSDGPARRPPLAESALRVQAPFMEERQIAAQLHAEHGFSALIALEKGGSTHRILFDAGMTPTGMVENMRVLGLSPKDVE